ncbi:MAG: ADP-forming succinate--CoA ligase subunit beta [Acidobacteriota bacterium]
MKLHEFQSKALLRQQGIRVPSGAVADSPAAARTIAESLAEEGTVRFAVKAQVHAGGRGKGGGIKLADSPEEVELHAATMLGSSLVTPQTGPGGVQVRRLLVEAAAQIANEIYVGITLDRSRRCPVVIASSEGGMEIEEVAAERPEAIHREWIAPGWGLQSFQARRLVYRLSLTGKPHRSASTAIEQLAWLYEDLDASLAEINPMVVTVADEVIALDAKIDIDDNVLFRRSDLQELRDRSEDDPLEVEASKHNLSYIALDGTVGCMVNGAGLAMATMDEILLAGGQPANFLDVGGGASVERVASAFRILMRAPRLSAVLINIFGGIVRCERVAKGIIEALDAVEVSVPVVVRLQGTNAAEGRKLLEDSSLDFMVAETLREAAEKAVVAAIGAGGPGNRHPASSEEVGS